MNARQMSAKIVLERLGWIERMLSEIRSLPLESFSAFTADPRTPAAAESYLRRALEALLDLGRHTLAKGFGRAPLQYKEIARELVAVGILTPEESTLLREMAGYRNRMVHFYHEISEEELYQICVHQLEDVEALLSTYQRWLRAHPEKIDQSL